MMSIPDLAFYNAGTNAPRGVQRVLILPRRSLRRLMRPMLHHLASILSHIYTRLQTFEDQERQLRADLQRLANQQEEQEHHLRADLQRLANQQEALSDTMQSALALGWDHVALARRLAVLEDQVARLSADQETLPRAWTGHSADQL